MTTTARVISTTNAHWYLPDATPFYEMPYADPKKGMRAVTLADARKVNALPSVTTVLGVIDKPALTAWKVEQGVLAVLTTPRQPGEADDAFVHRVLQVEKVQEQESKKARDLGSEIHDAIEKYYLGQEVPAEYRQYIDGALKEVNRHGELVSAEHILVGNGYAGKTDLIQKCEAGWWIWDFKTSKKLPKTFSYSEHILQLSAYAAAWDLKLNRAGDQVGIIRTGNCYISTTEPGKFVAIENNPAWDVDYAEGFLPTLKLWSYLNNYSPTNP